MRTYIHNYDNEIKKVSEEKIDREGYVRYGCVFCWHWQERFTYVHLGGHIQFLWYWWRGVCKGGQDTCVMLASYCGTVHVLWRVM